MHYKQHARDMAAAIEAYLANPESPESLRKSLESARAAGLDFTKDGVSRTIRLPRQPRTLKGNLWTTRRVLFESLPDIDLAKRFDVTRERIRQVRKQWFPDTSTRVNRVLGKAELFDPQWNLVRQIRRLLKEAGYFHCAKCHEWKSGDHQAGEQKRCRECNRRNTANWYKNHDGKAKARRWQRANPDKLREYQRRWRNKGVTPHPCLWCGVETTHPKVCSVLCKCRRMNAAKTARKAGT